MLLVFNFEKFFTDTLQVLPNRSDNSVLYFSSSKNLKASMFSRKMLAYEKFSGDRYPRNGNISKQSNFLKLI